MYLVILDHVISQILSMHILMLLVMHIKICESAFDK